MSGVREARQPFLALAVAALFAGLLAFGAMLTGCASAGKPVQTCRAGANDAEGKRLCLYEAAVRDLETLARSQTALLDATDAAQASGLLRASVAIQIHRASIAAGQAISAATVALDVSIEAFVAEEDPSAKVAAAYKAIADLWKIFAEGSR